MSRKVKHIPEGHMYITLKTYLDHLEAVERAKPPEQRRRVPSIKEMAGEIGLHEVTFRNIVNGNIKQLSLETGGKIITTMRRFGFAMDVKDLVDYKPIQEVV